MIQISRTEVIISTPKSPETDVHRPFVSKRKKRPPVSKRKRRRKLILKKTEPLERHSGFLIVEPRSGSRGYSPVHDTKGSAPPKKPELNKTSPIEFGGHQPVDKKKPDDIN